MYSQTPLPNYEPLKEARKEQDRARLRRAMKRDKREKDHDLGFKFMLGYCFVCVEAMIVIAGGRWIGWW